MTTTNKTVRALLTHGNTYSFECDSMQIAVITGKRRRDALRLHLSAFTFTSWTEAAKVAAYWRAANPRRAAA